MRWSKFVHGEAEAVLRVRRHLLQERGIHRNDLLATYWKLRRTDEQWRAEKRAWIAQAEPTTTQGGGPGWTVSSFSWGLGE